LYYECLRWFDPNQERAISQNTDGRMNKVTLPQVPNPRDVRAAGAPAGALVDQLGRSLRSLRVSVTDRCNLRCSYCMPQEEYIWLPREELLTFEEIASLIDVFTLNGVDDIHLTGGEPLLRPHLAKLVEMLAANPRIRDLALTTNAILLGKYAQELRAAGLHRVTMSLDTLRPERFVSLTRRDTHSEVLAGIEAARSAGFARLKINTVVLRGGNDDELADLIEFGRRVEAEVRFIEYMDVGGATDWSSDKVFSRAEMLDRLTKRYGAIEPLDENSSAPAQRFKLPDGTSFGIIASTTTPFCRSCDRSRLTADGIWYLCLYAKSGIDLRRPLREGVSSDDLSARVASVWREREDRGAELRTSQANRGVFVGIDQLRKDPHLEMHTRGG
jgi:cyclic pyranopterin phosphate synthase